MGGKKGQISLEYLIITGFVVLAILVPSFLILFSSTNKNVQGTVNTQKVLDLGKGIVNDAKQMYYLGLYSKKIVSYEVPQNVKNMFILKITDITDSKEFYYFVIVMLQGQENKVFTFQSDITIKSDINNPAVTNANNNALIAECALNPCEFFNFIGTTTYPGMKRFKVETKFDPVDGIVSEIIPVLQ